MYGFVCVSRVRSSELENERVQACSMRCDSLHDLHVFTKHTHTHTAVRTSEEEEDQGHDHGVAKVQYDGGQPADLQLGEEVVDGIDQEVDRRETAGQERTPLPVVVLETPEHPGHQSLKSVHTAHLCLPHLC